MTHPQHPPASPTTTLSPDEESVTYDTSSTPASVSTTNPPPDVYLNASVHIGEIDVLVENLTAKINLDAQVLELLNFNAGVSVSIEKVELLIENVTARVNLEACLSNLVLMIDDILSSLDLNPVLATLGQDLNNITSAVTSVLVSSSTTSTSSTTTSTGNTKRSGGGILNSYELSNNILYATNNYAGNTHKNRILAQNGDVVDRFLDNTGVVSREVIIGTYVSEMRFLGGNVTVDFEGTVARRLEYVYEPFRGLRVVSFVWVAVEDEKVLGTRVRSEIEEDGRVLLGVEVVVRWECN